MKLCDLIESVTIQGCIAVTVWENDNETETEIIDTFGLVSADVKPEWLEYEITYIYPTERNMLHIELQKTDD